MLRVTLLALALAVSRAAAQAPVITPKGDPSVQDDTIYRLTVDSAAHPGESRYYLLDDGVIRIEADGRETETYRQVVQILQQSAVDNYQEQSFSYEPGHQRLTINWIRVLTPDGTVISGKPSQVQTTDVPAQMGDPVYSDQKVTRASLTGVAVGTLVDISYTLEELKPFRAGDAYGSWISNNAVGVRRSRLLVDVPDSVHLTIDEHNLNFPRRTTHAHGRTVYLWATTNLARVKGEPYAATDSDTVITRIEYALPSTWQEVAAWYAGLARDRYTVTPAVAAKVDSLVAGAKTRVDSIRAVYKWVAQDIRYVSIALGIGGYRPRPPDSVLTTGFGDCKDKATLFVAALGHLGITAYPVLLNSDASAVNRALPSISQFNHAIAAVPNGSGYTFTDLTAEFRPYGTIPLGEQGGFALVVHPDGRADSVTLPEAPVDSNRSEMFLTGTLRPDGTIDARYEERASGSRAPSLRSVFETPFDSTTRANFLRTIATKFFTGASGDSLRAFPGKDLAARPDMSLDIHHGEAATISGNDMIFTIPFASAAAFGDMATELETYPSRRFPIDASQIVGPQMGIRHLEVALPQGWTARLPASVTATSIFGSYSAEFAQHGRVLEITRTLRGTRGIFPPGTMPELIAWYTAMAKDNARFIVIEHDGTH